jgi:hypothetical protein
MDPLSDLQALGLELPSLAFVIGAIAFGLIGLVAFESGARPNSDEPAGWRSR